MCGICGKLSYTGPVNEPELKLMADAIVHRGPDDCGYMLDKQVGLGFRRLSIIDLPTGHQPMSNAKGSLWITFNGEIYNFREQRSKLLGMGYTFHSQSDTEVILGLYEVYGESCVDHLRGMFAFVIYDKAREKLFFARDRFGIKPLYYAILPDRVLWGSEMKTLLTDPQLPRTMDLEAFDNYFTYGYIDRERSIYKSVRKLLPGHTMTISTRQSVPVSYRNYWKPAYRPDNTKTAAEWQEMIEAELKNTVNLHMISDVPIGAFLSGGIDSSSVVSLMQEQSSRPVNTFTIGFQENTFNEMPYAQELAAQLKTHHSARIIQANSVEILPKLVQAYDEPFADYSAIPTWYVSQFARETVTVALSGDGGDELFAGYDLYERFLNMKTRNQLPRFVRQTLFAGGLQCIPDGVRGKKMLLLLSKQANEAPAFSAMWHNYERQKLYTPLIREELGSYRAETDRVALLNSHLGPEYLAGLQLTDMLSYLPEDILTKVDRASMAHSLEVRVPLLDHVFAELSFSIPVHYKLEGHQRKIILKQAMAKYLPPSIFNHKKTGFVAPLSAWFKNELAAYCKEVLLMPQAPLYHYFNRKYVQEILAIHLSGKRDFGGKLWSLLFFNEWLQQHGK